MNTKKLFGKTRPENLKQVAVVSFLSFFVFTGSFFVADATVYMIAPESSMLAQAGGTRCGACHGTNPSQPAPHPAAGRRGPDGKPYNPYNDDRSTWTYPTKPTPPQPKPKPSAPGSGTTGSGNGGTGGTPTKSLSDPTCLGLNCNDDGTKTNTGI